MPVVLKLVKQFFQIRRISYFIKGLALEVLALIQGFTMADWNKTRKVPPLEAQLVGATKAKIFLTLSA